MFVWVSSNHKVIVLICFLHNNFPDAVSEKNMGFTNRLEGPGSTSVNYGGEVSLPASLDHCKSGSAFRGRPLFTHGGFLEELVLVRVLHAKLVPDQVAFSKG